MPRSRPEAHAILGLREGATVEEITMAYRRLASKFHPDREDGNSAQMSALNTARDALLAPEPVPARVRPKREPNCYSDYFALHRRAI